VGLHKVRKVLSVGIVYLFIGIATAAISNPMSDTRAQTMWRLASLVISAAVFACHIWPEMNRRHNTVRRTALESSGAVALGTFLLAVSANIHAMSRNAETSGSLLLALLIWPIITGASSYIVAIVLSKRMARMRSKAG
jgi:hypothetical protein